ncbi:MAG: polysaccharide biosynthesis/export family protein, partial [Betaproteobacteria bacterium]|nr:polysaccharide biosynthesis/export family protein [Betaproteobacteria bacterium]
QATAPAPKAPASGDAYRLGPGDVVDITVYNNPDLETKTAIGQDGHVSFPLIGSVALAGLTPAQAGERIAHQLDAGGFVRKPYVNILVTEYRSQTVSVLGEVNSPGAYNISRPIDITQALAMAGGINPKGSNVVVLVTKGPDGAPRRQKIDITRLIEDGSTPQDPLVASGTIIYVPPAPVFYIYGEVRNPGAYPLTSGLTVQQALSVGGGLTVRGTQNGIELDRKGPDGREHSRRARLSERLQPGDVLQVPESWF